MSTGFNHSVIKNASIILRNYFKSAWQSTPHCEIMVNKLVLHTMKIWVIANDCHGQLFKARCY